MTDAIIKAKKEGISMEFMMSLIQPGTKFFNIGEKPLTEDDSFDIITVMIMFHIDITRVREIIIYIKKLMKDYNGSAADVLRDIYHNIIGHEKYLVVYILGKNFTEKIVIEEQVKLVSDILQKLDISDEKFKSTTHFLDNIFEAEIIDRHVYPPHSIMKIMESEFEENEKVFMVFIYGLK